MFQWYEHYFEWNMIVSKTKCMSKMKEEKNESRSKPGKASYAGQKGVSDVIKGVTVGGCTNAEEGEEGGCRWRSHYEESLVTGLRRPWESLTWGRAVTQGQWYLQGTSVVEL